MNGLHGLLAWRWLFILEGAITIGIAIVAFVSHEPGNHRNHLFRTPCTLNLRIHVETESQEHPLTSLLHSGSSPISREQLRGSRWRNGNSPSGASKKTLVRMIGWTASTSRSLSG